MRTSGDPSNNVLPRLAANGVAHRRLAHAEYSGELRIVFLRVAPAELTDNFWRELRLPASLNVDGWCYRLKMVRVYARRISAQMINVKSRRNWTSHIFIPGSVHSHNTFSLGVEPCRVSVGVQCSFPDMAWSYKSTILFNPTIDGVLSNVVIEQEAGRNALLPSNSVLRDRRNPCLSAASALAKAERNLIQGAIVRVRHRIASLQAIRGATARSVRALPGSLRCLNYTKNPVGMGEFRG